MFNKLIPTIKEISEYVQVLRLVSNSADFKDFIEGYPLVTQQFKQLCKDLQNDTIELNFSSAPPIISDMLYLSAIILCR